MKKFKQYISSLLPALLVVTCLAGNAGAALQAVGPTDLVTTIPTWYQDTNNLALAPCLDQNGFCLLPPPFDPAFPPVTTITTTGPVTDANFPGEGFYYSADAIMPIEAGELARLTFVLEFAFLGGVIPDTGTTFLRTDLQKMQNLAPNATYRVTHPYGTFEFTTDAAGNTTGGGGVAVRQEDGTGTAANYLPTLMQSAATTGIGPFLTPASGVFPTALVGGVTHTYIGDAITPVAVTGSPTGNNFYRIERLTAGGGVAATWQTNLFTLSGLIFTGQIPSPMAIDRVTYARDASSEQVDVFATALPTAILTISGTGITNTDLTRDIAPNTTKYFTHIPLASTTLPSGLNITNSLDVPPIPYPVTLVDEVNISQAYYNPVNRTMTIKAASRDKLAPLPTLTVPQFAAPNTLDAAGTLVKTLPLNAIPPLTVTVHSSKLGEATAFVSVVTPPAPPVAVDDAATTTFNTAVTIDVIANDTTNGTLDPASIVTASPVGGAAVANPNGTVTFTPTTGFSGAASFTYTVADTFGQASNSATVAITVSGAPVVANNDTATTPTGSTIIISVLANDTVSAPAAINPASVAVSAATGGSVAANLDGTVSYTAPATTGTYTFTYTVKDNAAVPSTSNVATVTVTVTLAPASRATLTATPASPQTVGIPQVVFNATGSGGTGPYEYKFQQKIAGLWTTVQNYSTTTSFSWNSSAQPAGTYAFQVLVRNVGSTAALEAGNAIFYTINPVPATGATLTAAPASPQTAGIPQVVFNATGVGGTGTYEFKFQQKLAGVWTTVQNYGTLASYTWNSSAQPAGSYAFQVLVRSAGSTRTFEAGSAMAYTINP